MKKLLAVTILFSSLFLAWACNDKNNNPTTPTTPPGGTAVPSGTTTPGSPTNTPTLPAGANTPTFTPTPNGPPYLSEWPAASAPNGFYLAPANQLYVAEGDTVLPEMEVYNTTTGVVVNHWNLEYVTVNGAAVTVQLNNPIGVAWTPLNPGGNYLVILDGTSNGGASIYTGTSIGNTDVNTGTQWGTLALKSPQGFATDGNYFYVADTGNGYIEEFDPYSGPNPGPIHRWKGYSPNNFVKPAAVATDPYGNIWVGDSGYNPSLIEEFQSGGTTWVTQFSGVPNCVVNGMAVTATVSAGVTTWNVYVSDSGNGQVEEYNQTGALLRYWNNPHGPHEFQPFKPSCIAIDTANNQIIVGDQNNDTIEVFGP